MAKAPVVNIGGAAVAAKKGDFSSRPAPVVNADPDSNPATAALIAAAGVHSRIDAPAAPAQVQAEPALSIEGNPKEPKKRRGGGTSTSAASETAKGKEKPRFYLDDDIGLIAKSMELYAKRTGRFASQSRIVRAALRHLSASTTPEERVALIDAVPDKRTR